MRKIVYVTLVLLCFSAFAAATNQVVVTAKSNYSAGDSLVPIVWGQFEIAIENDVELSGISLGFILSGTASFQFMDAGGFTVNPPGEDFVTGILGSRWMNDAAPDGSCWDLSGTQVTFDPDGSQPYQFLISGVSSGTGLAPGPLQPMFEVNYMIDCWADINIVKELCIDSLLYQPAGDFIFVPGGTPSFYVTNGINGCFPVSRRPCCCCPEWDEDNPTSMNVHAGGTGQVTLSATDPEMDPVYYYLLGVTGGAGTATVGLNDGVVTYEADPADVGADIQITVEATDPVHQHGGCAYFAWTIDVTVTDNTPPTIDCGRLYHFAAPPNVMTKTDIIVEDPDEGNTHTFYWIYISPAPIGSYNIDPATGALTFTPATQDQGMYDACIGVTDGIDSASCCFTIEVLPSDCCTGDVNFDGNVNISDAVFLVNYIFKGGAAPQIMNFGDVNADCDINIADVVYLISYIFKGGPAPQVGCYY